MLHPSTLNGWALPRQGDKKGGRRAERTIGAAGSHVEAAGGGDAVATEQ